MMRSSGMRVLRAGSLEMCVGDGGVFSLQDRELNVLCGSVHVYGLQA